MSNPRHRRRALALLAAYVVALQALLLPLTLAAFAMPGSVLCSAAGQSQPASHVTDCPCAAGCGMQCCAQTLLGPSAETANAFFPAIVTGVAPPSLLTANVRPLERGPQAPRAPPAA